MPKLGVNIDHVATIRQARQTYEPEPVTAAALVELAGAHGIVVHLREDRRHIQDRDLPLLRQTIQTQMNLEMAAAEEIIQIALEVRPDKVTLVPEKREEVTTEGGLDVAGNLVHLTDSVRRLSSEGIPVSMFIEADDAQIQASLDSGAEGIELHTGSYAEASDQEEQLRELRRLMQATEVAIGLGLKVHMGHGLTYRNVGPIVEIAGVEELNIGHTIVSRAVLVGLDRAVREMLALIQ